MIIIQLEINYLDFLKEIQHPNKNFSSDNKLKQDKLLI